MVNFDRTKIDGTSCFKTAIQKIEFRTPRQQMRWKRLLRPGRWRVNRNFVVGLGELAKGGNHPPAKEIDSDKGKLAEYGLNNPK